MGQTRVDLMHLLEDLRDAYPGSLEETIVGETVANALDSGARRITLDADAVTATLTIGDDGVGMTRAQLRRYHDLAATSKRRGRGIGFAGVGIKLALLGCDEVVTETQRDGRTYASSWRLASRQKAPWEWIQPPGMTTEPSGTAVRMHFSNPLVALLEPGWLATTILRHFAPLFDPAFDDILAGAYARGVGFRVNGRQLPRASLAHVRILGDASVIDRATISARLPRKRKPSATGWLVRTDGELPEEERGVAIATLGKVIKRGWDWLGVAPATPERISGLIDAPGLAESLTLNKADFIRTGSRGATYLAYRKAIQEAVTAQLALWGDAPEPRPARRPRTRRIEKDLENVLVDLAGDFPLIGSLVDRRRGGQRKIPFGNATAGDGDLFAPAGEMSVWPGGSQSAPEHAPSEAAGSTPPRAPEGNPPPETPPSPSTADAKSGDVSTPGRAAGKKPGRYGLVIDFETRDDDPQLARLVESTVWVNEGHPAWRRALLARSEGYHIALSVAMALAPLAAEPAAAHDFLTTFLQRWGRAAEDGKKRTRSRR